MFTRALQEQADRTGKISKGYLSSLLLFTILASDCVKSECGQSSASAQLLLERFMAMLEDEVSTVLNEHRAAINALRLYAFETRSTKT